MADDDIDWNDPSLLKYCSPPHRPAINSINRSNGSAVTGGFVYQPPQNIYRPNVSNTANTQILPAPLNATQFQQPKVVALQKPVQPTISSYAPAHVARAATKAASLDIPDDVFASIDIPRVAGSGTAALPNRTAHTATHNNVPVTPKATALAHRASSTTSSGTVNPFAKPGSATSAQPPSVHTTQQFLSPALTMQQHQASDSAPRVAMCRQHSIAMIQQATKKPGPNLGRKFWCCALPREDKCNEFVWDDDRVAYNKLPRTTIDTRPPLTTTIELVGPDRIAVACVPYDPKLDDLLRHKLHGSRVPNQKGMVFALSQQAEIINQITEYATSVSVKLRCDSIADNVVKVLNADRKQHFSLLNSGSIDFVDDLIDLTDITVPNTDDLFNADSPIKHPQNASKKRKRKAKGSLAHRYDIEPLFDAARVPTDLWAKLMPFQQQGVAFAVNHGGRAHISDEMGLGKTIQGCVVAHYYKSDWPLLIICPSSVRLNWRMELLEWLREHVRDDEQQIDGDDINVVMSSSTNLSSDKPITIISYDLTSRMADRLAEVEFNCIICDESHYLKSADAKRTQVIVPMIKRAKRALLLSGTPALNRPNELFTQIDSLLPGLLPKYNAFGMRYCAGKPSRWGPMDYSGGSNLTELYQLLTKHVLIRREKSAVLTQLPAKRRQQIVIDVPEGLKLKKKLLKSKSDEHNLEKLLAMALNGNNGDNDLDAVSQPVLFALFMESGKMKLPGVCDYVDVLLDSEVKFLIFAYHIAVLDGIEKQVQKRDVGYMRIDGRTKPEQRQLNVNTFQSDPQCRVAVLSTAAAGTGLTLHAASTVVFAELMWSPMTLVQAEDRVHRIGQQNNCNIHYLIGRGTIDDELWPMLRRKFDMLGDALSESYQTDQLNAFDMKTVEKPADAQQQQLHFFPASATATSKVENTDVQRKSSQHVVNNIHIGEQQLDIPSSSVEEFLSMPALEPDDDERPIAAVYGTHIQVVNDDDSDDDVPIAFKRVKTEQLTQSSSHTTDSDKSAINGNHRLSLDTIDLLDVDD